MADLFPVNQVPAVEKWNPRKILKAAVNQIIIFACAADTGIRIKSRYYGILKFHGFFPH